VLLIDGNPRKRNVLKGRLLEAREGGVLEDEVDERLKQGRYAAYRSKLLVLKH